MAACPQHMAGPSTPGAGLDADPQAVLGDQRGRVAVVGRDGRLGDVQPAGAARRSVSGCRASAPSRSRTRSLSSLAALRVNVSPRIASGSTSRLATSQRHPGGHRLGLARPGAGDDDQRPVGRRGDDRAPAPATARRTARSGRRPRPGRAAAAAARAARRRVGEEVVEGELVRRGTRAHPVTCRPGSCSGQLRRAGHRGQCVPVRTSKVPAPMPSPTSASSSPAQVSASGTSAGSGSWCCSLALAPVPTCSSAAPPGRCRGRRTRPRRRPPGRRRAGRAPRCSSAARLAGLEVDDDQPAVGVALQPVDLAADAAPGRR